MKRASPWDMGHRPGMEYWKERANAVLRWMNSREAMTRREFLDRMNDPSRYQPELPASNRSHRAEDVSNSYWD
ncbi:MAG: HNH/ENDO VII family nuclease [Xanthomonadales bacterium]|nr:HNH/ENDO VII family nuclease [Xanthomonadales bacterium]